MTQRNHGQGSITARVRDVLDAIGPTGVDRVAAEAFILDALISSARELEGEDRFAFNWRGKRNALGVLQRPPLGALHPEPGEDGIVGDGFHSAIEGDCLEVMKLLEKAYFGRVKMVYMNPPFNIDGDIVIDDSDGYLDRYLAYVGGSGSVSDIGRRGGADHSAWLAMMHVRLLVARNLLASDGVIFVSIDDHESHRLRLVMDEVFGEENFVASFVWEKRYSPAPDATDVGYVHESILCYRRSEDFAAGLLPMTDDQTGRYKNPDDDPRGPWKPADYTCRYTATERPNLYYPIQHPKTGEEVWPKKTRVWACSQSEHEKNVAEGRLWWGESGDSSVPAKKRFLFEIRQGFMPKSILQHDEVGHTDEATKQLRRHLPDIKASPKPTGLMRHLLAIANVGVGDTVLDCYARTGALGEAVLELEAEQGRGPACISVEFPERLQGQEMSLSEAMFTRLRSAYQIHESKLQSGIRFFRLGRSCFRHWDADVVGESEPPILFETQVAKGCDAGVLLRELLLSSGVRLDTVVSDRVVAGLPVHSVNDDELIICLAPRLSAEFFDEVSRIANGQVVCLDSAFDGDDAMKVNAHHTLEKRGESLGAPVMLKAI